MLQVINYLHHFYRMKGSGKNKVWDQESCLATCNVVLLFPGGGPPKTYPSLFFSNSTILRIYIVDKWLTKSIVIFRCYVIGNTENKNVLAGHAFWTRLYVMV